MSNASSPNQVRERLEQEEYARLSPLAAKAAEATRPRRARQLAAAL